MKLYRVTAHNFGIYGPRGMTINGTGLVTWAYTDKAQALKRYARELKAANKEKRKAYLRLQILVTPTMTTERWIQAIVDGEVPYEVSETIRRDKVSPAMELAA